MAPAQAAEEAKGAEARAIKKAFLQGREEPTAIKKILISTSDPSFASVSFTVTIDQTRSAGKTYKAPVPTILTERKGKWKPTAKPPKKTPKDLKPKDPKSSIEVSGEHTVSLSRPASCSSGGGGANVYDSGTDTLLSVQFHGGYYKGPGIYSALGVGSVAGLYGNSGQVLVYETGESNDAFSSSGIIYVDRGWGIVDAYMSRTPPDESTVPNSVLVSGTWTCR